MNKLSVPAFALLALLAGSALAQGDPQTGREKASTCMGCHSIPGYTNTYPTYNVPKLGGQQPAYIVQALKAYASGDRSHPTMRANAATLGEQDMQDIAAFFAQSGGQSTQADQADAAAGPQKAQLCASCHGPGGNKPIQPAYAKLGGQHQSYLAQALMAYKSGARQNPVMQGQAAGLTDQEIEELASYFARQKGLDIVNY